MKECTNPQYVIRATDENFHTEIFSVEPGAYPSIVNEIPPGQPTIPQSNPTEMVQAIAKLLAEHGHCKMPETFDTPTSENVEQAPESENSVPSGLAALNQNIERRNTRSIEQVPATPDIYLQKTESVDSVGGGAVAGVVLIPAILVGGRMLAMQVQQRMFPLEVDPTVMNYENETPENIYEHPQPVASVSAVPAHEPSPWARPVVHAGNPYQQGDFGRNDAPKWSRNGVEMSRNDSRNESKWAEMTPEMKPISTEMTSEDEDRINRVRQRLSGLLTKPEPVVTQVISTEMTPEIKAVSGYFDPTGDLTQAKELYFQLREQGLSTATDLGGAIFGVRGGDKWASVSPILQGWNTEWENKNG